MSAGPRRRCSVTVRGAISESGFRVISRRWAAGRILAVCMPCPVAVTVVTVVTAAVTILTTVTCCCCRNVLIVLHSSRDRMLLRSLPCDLSLLQL